MNKSLSINLGGSLFKVEEEAYQILRDYIYSISSRFRNTEEGNETINDLELRIAEIFRQRQEISGIISRDDVIYMISVIGKPEEIAPDEKEIPFSHGSKRLFRNPDDKVIAGVAGGLGVYFDIDPVLFRILFAVFTLLGGAGLLIYIVFWIAVPSALSESSKQQMYGRLGNDKYSHAQNTGLSEITHSIGKAFYIFFRIILIIIGSAFVLMGFTMLLTYIFVFLLNFPEAFRTDGFDQSFNYIELLRNIFNPETARWMAILISVAVLLPLLALVYWGTKMIFWFRVRDVYFNLAFFLLWVAALTALSALFFDEGIGFAETSSTTTKNILNNTTDTLYLTSGRKLDNIVYEKKFVFNDSRDIYFLIDSAGNKYLNPSIRLIESDDNSTVVEVRKQSSAKTRFDAHKKTETIEYEYKINNDTLSLNEFFVIPSTRKWSADIVKIRLHIPENTVIHADDDLLRFFDLASGDFRERDNWLISRNRLQNTHFN